MNSICLFVAMGLLALAAGVSGQHEDKALAKLQEELQRSLARVEPNHRREVEAFMAIVEATPATDWFDDEYKLAGIAYRESKGDEATKTEQQRNQLFDYLEESCQDVKEQLGAFNELDKSQPVIVELDEASELAKWRRTYEGCSRFLLTCSRAGVAAEAKKRNEGKGWNSHRYEGFFNEIRGLGEFAPRPKKQQSRLGKLLRPAKN